MTHRPFPALPVGSLGLLLVACNGRVDTDDWNTPDDTGSVDTDTDTDTDTGLDDTGSVDTDTDTDTDTAVEWTEHCDGTTPLIVETNITWSAADNPHLITCGVKIEGGNLVIEEGTEVYFTSSGYISVSPSGTQGGLSVNGTVADPVWFGPSTGEGYAKWDGVFVSQFAGNVSLHNLTINGGGRGWLGSLSLAEGSLNVEGVPITVENVTVEDAPVGAVFASGGRLHDGATGFVATNNREYPVQIDGSVAHTLPATDSAYTGNGIDKIYVRSDTITNQVTWEDLGVPYAIFSTLKLEGIAVAPALLTLTEGVELQFGYQGKLSVSEQGGAAGLLSLGTEQNPIVMRSAQSNLKKHWEGITVWEAALDDQVALEYTHVTDAGGNLIYQTNVRVEDTPIHIDHLTSTRSWSAGFKMYGPLARFTDDSEGLVITDNFWSMILPASSAHTIPSDPDSSYTGNHWDAIYINPGTIISSVTWGALDSPYFVNEGIVQVRGIEPGSAAILTLEPGVDIWMSNNAQFVFGQKGLNSNLHGGLIAEGQIDHPIRFTAGDVYEAGQWSGLEFQGCDDDDFPVGTWESTLRYVEIDYGDPNLAYANDCTPTTLEHVTLRHSGGYGITGLEATWLDGQTGITYEDNASGDYPTD